jgi:hypothetical protein
LSHRRFRLIHTQQQKSLVRMSLEVTSTLGSLYAASTGPGWATLSVTTDRAASFICNNAPIICNAIGVGADFLAPNTDSSHSTTTGSSSSQTSDRQGIDLGEKGEGGSDPSQANPDSSVGRGQEVVAGALRVVAGGATAAAAQYVIVNGVRVVLGAMIELPEILAEFL